MLAVFHDEPLCSNGNGHGPNCCHTNFPRHIRNRYTMAFSSRFRAFARTAFLLASRASADVHWRAVPFSCAALPPLLASSCCRSFDIDAKPRSWIDMDASLRLTVLRRVDCKPKTADLWWIIRESGAHRQATTNLRTVHDFQRLLGRPKLPVPRRHRLQRRQARCG